MLKTLLVGDYSETVVAHGAIPKALSLAAKRLGVSIRPTWLETAKIDSAHTIREEYPSGIWCVPGSPYANMEGALMAIRFAREKKIPFLGTCGGFQHALIEYARNVLGISEADHAESSPGARAPVISKLQCALINQSEQIRLTEDSNLQRIYGAERIKEAYQCSYGLNPEFEVALGKGGLRFTAFNETSGVRAFELARHPFFIGTLFQPERSALAGKVHPLITAFVQAQTD